MASTASVACFSCHCSTAACVEPDPQTRQNQALSLITGIDDALVGGKQKGKRGSGAAGKKNVLIAYESKDKKAGISAMAVVDSICRKTNT